MATTTSSQVKITSAPGTATIGNVSMNNTNSVRYGDISPTLLSLLSRIATQSYGPTAKVSVYSGSNTEDSRTGTRRHDNGQAADVYITVDGKRLTGAQLAPMAQNWLANDAGSVGYGMADGGMHLDLHGGAYGAPLRGGEGRTWNYGSQPQEITNAFSAGLAKKLANDGTSIDPGTIPVNATTTVAESRRQSQASSYSVAQKQGDADGYEITVRDDEYYQGLQEINDSLAQDNSIISADQLQRFQQTNAEGLGLTRTPNPNQVTIIQNLADIGITSSIERLKDSTTFFEMLPGPDSNQSIVAPQEVEAAIQYRNSLKSGAPLTNYVKFFQEIESKYFSQQNQDLLSTGGFSNDSILYWIEKYYQLPELSQYTDSREAISRQLQVTSNYNALQLKFIQAQYQADLSSFIKCASDSIGLLANSKYHQLDSTQPIFDIAQQLYGVPIPFTANMENKVGPTARNLAYNLSKLTTAFMRVNLQGIAYYDPHLGKNYEVDSSSPHGQNLVNDIGFFVKFAQRNNVAARVEQTKNAFTGGNRDKLFNFIKYISNIGNRCAYNLRDVYAPIDGYDRDFKVSPSSFDLNVENINPEAVNSQIRTVQAYSDVNAETLSKLYYDTANLQRSGVLLNDTKVISWDGKGVGVFNSTGVASGPVNTSPAVAANSINTTPKDPNAVSDYDLLGKAPVEEQEAENQQATTNQNPNRIAVTIGPTTGTPWIDYKSTITTAESMLRNSPLLNSISDQEAIANGIVDRKGNPDQGNPAAWAQYLYRVGIVETDGRVDVVADRGTSLGVWSNSITNGRRFGNLKGTDQEVATKLLTDPTANLYTTIKYMESRVPNTRRLDSLLATRGGQWATTTFNRLQGGGRFPVYTIPTYATQGRYNASGGAPTVYTTVNGAAPYTVSQIPVLNQGTATSQGQPASPITITYAPGSPSQSASAPLAVVYDENGNPITQARAAESQQIVDNANTREYSNKQRVIPLSFQIRVEDINNQPVKIDVDYLLKKIVYNNVDRCRSLYSLATANGINRINGGVNSTFNPVDSPNINIGGSLVGAGARLMEASRNINLKNLGSTGNIQQVIAGLGINSGDRGYSQALTTVSQILGQNRITSQSLTQSIGSFIGLASTRLPGNIMQSITTGQAVFDGAVSQINGIIGASIPSSGAILETFNPLNYIDINISGFLPSAGLGSIADILKIGSNLATSGPPTVFTAFGQARALMAQLNSIRCNFELPFLRWETVEKLLKVKWKEVDIKKAISEELEKIGNRLKDLFDVQKIYESLRQEVDDYFLNLYRQLFTCTGKNRNDKSGLFKQIRSSDPLGLL